MADTNDIKKGFKLLDNGNPCVVVEHQFVKPGKGAAIIRTRIKNLITGAVIDRTYRSGDKLEVADVVERQMQYLYPEGDEFVFMDTDTYDQMRISKKQLGDSAYFLLDNMNIDVMLFNGNPIGVTPPTFVELVVTSTEPGFKGDTSSNTFKPATLETGLEVMVPLFVAEGDKLKIDTRDSSYVERVKS